MYGVCRVWRVWGLEGSQVHRAFRVCCVEAWLQGLGFRVQSFRVQSYGVQGVLLLFWDVPLIRTVLIIGIIVPPIIIPIKDC